MNIAKITKIAQTKYMTYYNYHAVAMNLIRSGHCIKAELKEKQNHISPALLLFFDNHKPMPIRQESFGKYFELLKFYKIPIFSLINKNKH